MAREATHAEATTVSRAASGSGLRLSLQQQLGVLAFEFVERPLILKGRAMSHQPLTNYPAGFFSRELTISLAD